MKIIYRIGDATAPQSDNSKEVMCIAHICNNVRAWGAGFVLALSRKWSGPEKLYRALPEENMKLGEVSVVQVEDNIVVANMIAQDNVQSRMSKDQKSPIRYDALVTCLISVSKLCETQNMTLHLPRIGAGLAGGNWKAIEALIEEHIEVPVYVYDLDPVHGTTYSGDLKFVDLAKTNS